MRKGQVIIRKILTTNQHVASICTENIGKQENSMTVVLVQTLTEGSHSSEPFFTQVNHLISSNRFSKQVMNPADFPTLKIWDQSDH